jgi:hypothetical protein
MEKKKTYYTIQGHEGEWYVKETKISELGFIMVAFYNEATKCTMRINMGTLDDALKATTFFNTED